MKIKKSIVTVKSIITDKERKPFTQISKEFTSLWREHGEIPIHYFTRFLFRKEFVNYKDFIPTQTYFRLIYSEAIQNEKYVEILEDKRLFGEFCIKNNIPAPLFIGYNEGSEFTFPDSTKTTKSITELIEFYQNLFKKEALESVFIKKMVSKGGKDIYKITSQNFSDILSQDGKAILSGNFIHQAGIVQHPDINKIYAGCINTLRFDIAVDEESNLHLLGAVMRFGAGGSYIDNRSMGGFFISVDAEKGQLLKNGYMQMGFGGKKIEKHPDTGFVFEGFEIPFFHEAVELVFKASSLIPNKLLGWDIAITPDGPVVVEGNYASNITMTEVAYGGYLKHPIIKEFLKLSNN